MAIMRKWVHVHLTVTGEPMKILIGRKRVH